MSKSLLQSADIKNLKVEGDTSLHNLTINGTHTLNGSNTITKDLKVEGDTSLHNLTVMNDLNVEGTLTVNGKIKCDTLEVNKIVYNGKTMIAADLTLHMPSSGENFLYFKN